MDWLYLTVAGLFEIAWAVGLKYTDGFSRPWPSAATGLVMLASFYFLAQGLKTISVGTGYAVWTGIGASGTGILGIVLFSEPTTLLLLLLASLGLIVAGIVGLKLSA